MKPMEQTVDSRSHWYRTEAQRGWGRYKNDWHTHTQNDWHNRHKKANHNGGCSILEENQSLRI